MKRITSITLYFLICCLSSACGSSEPDLPDQAPPKPPAFTSWIVGDTADVVTQPLGGIVLAGGGTDVDEAMHWLLQRANGGDVLIIRASGSDGYNDYLFRQLGVRVNSVETLLLNSRTLSNNAAVLRKVRGAEAIFFAGGDQANYVNFYRDTPLATAINERIRVGAVLGGTSAGCAILGQVYYSALNGSVTTDEALANPYNPAITLGLNNFLQQPLLANTVTDQHYTNRNREGRHLTFLARTATGLGGQPRGIGVDERTAVCVLPNGQATVFGTGTAYFLLASAAKPEVCQPGKPLTWLADKQAVSVTSISGSPTGTKVFDLITFRPLSNATTSFWYADAGQFIKR
ncbi:MAG: cyanophycinase [Spirosoma sp.]|nr:cyanophycinase [Spirosoma sp.]